MSNTVTGTEAISYLVSHSFRQELATITETRAGIDVDNAGRYYEHTTDTDYNDLLWTVLNYMPDERSLRYTGLDVAQGIDALYSAELEEREFGSHSTSVIKSFHIHTDVYDSESRGSHFDFIWK